MGDEVHDIWSAAAVEAIAFGHPEVDVDHLLLGLLVTGGSSARVLTEHGVGVAALRRAVAGLQEQDLLGLGVLAATPQPVTVRAADRVGAPTVPLGGRARRLLDETSYLGDDRELLRAVLDDEGRRAERLLAHLGVDVDEVRAQVEAEPAADGRPAATFETNASDVDWSAADSSLMAWRDSAPAGTTWMSAVHTQLVPVTGDRVWALVSDPRRRPEWDATCSGSPEWTRRRSRPDDRPATR